MSRYVAICLFFVWSGIDYADDLNKDPSKEAGSYVVHYLDEHGKPWGRDDFDSLDKAKAAIRRQQEGYTEMAWGKLKTTITFEQDLLAGKPTRTKFGPSDFRNDFVRLREKQLGHTDATIDKDASSHRRWKEHLAKLRQDTELATQNELPTRLLEEAIKEAESRILAQALNLSKRRADIATVRDAFIADKENLKFGKTYTPTVLAERNAAANETTAYIAPSKKVTPNTRPKRVIAPKKLSLTYGRLIGEWGTRSASGKFRRRVTFLKDGRAMYSNWNNVFGRVHLDGNRITFSTDESWSRHHGIDFDGQWKGETIEYRVRQHFLDAGSNDVRPNSSTSFGTGSSILFKKD